MIFGKQWTVVQETALDVDFRCACCGHEAPLRVLTYGAGSSFSAFMLDNAGAKQRAAASAQHGLGDNAAMLLSHATCPKCGRMAPGVASAFVGRRAAWALGATLFFTLLAGWFAAHDIPLAPAILGTFAAVSPILVYLAARKEWLARKVRVSVVPAGAARPLPPDPAGLMRPELEPFIRQVRVAGALAAGSAAGLRHALAAHPEVQTVAAALPAAAILPRRTPRRDALLVGGLVLAVLLVATGYWQFTGSYSRLHLLNGFDVPLTVVLDGGEPWPLGPAGHDSRWVQNGAHTLAVRRMNGSTLASEQVTLLPRADVTVFNIAGVAPLFSEQVIYASGPAPASEQRPLNGKSFVQLSGIDHTFTAPPESIELRHGDDEARRMYVDVLPGGWRSTVALLGSQKKLVEAGRVAERVALTDPTCADAAELARAYYTKAGARQDIERLEAKLASAAH